MLGEGARGGGWGGGCQVTDAVEEVEEEEEGRIVDGVFVGAEEGGEGEGQAEEVGWIGWGERGGLIVVMGWEDGLSGTLEGGRPGLVPLGEGS